MPSAPFFRPVATGLLLLVLGSGAACAAPLPGVLTLTPAQRQAMGIESQLLQGGGDGYSPGMPARVTIPTGRLRVVAAPVAGLVERIAVAPGETVKRGQVLGRLASPQLLEMQRDYQVASSQSGLAAQALQRDETLYREGIIAAARIEATRAAARQARITAGQRAAVLRLSGLEPVADGAPAVSAAVISPIAGVVLEQNVAVGQRVDMAAPLFRIGQLASLWLEIQVPATFASQWREGAAVRISGSRATGRLIAVGQQLGEGQTLTLRAQITEGTEHLRPGQAVEARIDLGDMRDEPAAPLWKVPAAALVRLADAGEPHVFVESERGMVPVPVSIRGQTGDGVLVSGTLPARPQVVIRGVAALKAAWLARTASGK
ncbi:MAG: efflux RND transporter periplasmic adaptor subunit [Proteobacteria bacterium]|nr:efflux RND transporter periplasmic adaptor subunit [Pseudomonadota bacterium]HQR03601.1 efflux RND transporter periplasmic adaptor subunit [Rhodocyclaceae bacterium]